MPDPLTIKKLTVRDVLRVSVVEITPDGNVVTLGGANASGKSSVLNAIELALAGLRRAPPQPIRRGAERGEVIVDLGDIVVERTFTAAGSDLVVKAKDGARYPKPQAMLDALFAEIAFDPLAFSRMEAGPQADALRRLVGIDVSDLDAERERLFAERTEVNRDGKAAKARLDAQARHENAPAVEVQPGELAQELESRLGIQRANADLREKHRQATARAAAGLSDVQRLERELEAAREALAVQMAHAATLTAQIDSIQEPDVGEIRARIAAVEAQNAKVRDNRAHARLAAEVEGMRARSGALSGRLTAIEAERSARIAAAKFPVEGLGFGESGVTLSGFPFEQASQAEKLRVSVAIGVAKQPRLRVFFVRDGSLLDADNLRALAALAVEKGCQLWVEDARTVDEHAIIISDGMVRGAVAEEQGTLPGVET